MPGKRANARKSTKHGSSSRKIGTHHAGAHRRSGATASGQSSGRPGGGAGRREEVKGSGVYPASAPSAPGDAQAQGMASFGQGERGAAGYQDSGTSEISTAESQKGIPGLGSTSDQAGAKPKKKKEK